MTVSLHNVYKIVLENRYEGVLSLLNKKDSSFERIFFIVERIKDLIKLNILNKQCYESVNNALTAVESSLKKNPSITNQPNEKLHRTLLAGYNRQFLGFKIVIHNRLSEKFPALFPDSDDDVPKVIDEETKAIIGLNRINKIFYKEINSIFDNFAIREMEAYNFDRMKEDKIDSMIVYANQKRPFLIFWRKVLELREQMTSYTFAEEPYQTARENKNRTVNEILDDYKETGEPIPASVLAAMQDKPPISKPATHDQLVEFYLNYCKIFSKEINFGLVQKLNDCKKPHVLHGYIEFCIDSRVEIDLKRIEQIDREFDTLSSQPQMKTEESRPSVSEKLSFGEYVRGMMSASREIEDDNFADLVQSLILDKKDRTSSLFKDLAEGYIIRCKQKGEKVLTEDEIYKELVKGDEKTSLGLQQPKPENLKTFQIFVQFIESQAITDLDKMHFKQFEKEYHDAIDGKRIQPLLQEVLKVYIQLCGDQNVKVPEEEINKLGVNPNKLVNEIIKERDSRPSSSDDFPAKREPTTPAQSVDDYIAECERENHEISIEKIIELSNIAS